MANIRKRSEGTYEIKVSCGYDVSGKQSPPHWTLRNPILTDILTEAKTAKKIIGKWLYKLFF